MEGGRNQKNVLNSLRKKEERQKGRKEGRKEGRKAGRK